MKTSAKLLRRDTSQFAMVCDATLRRGLQVRFLAHGQSMQPNVLNGDAVIAEPVDACELRRGDIALTLGAHGVLLHRVIGLDPKTNRIVTRGDAGQQNDTPAELVLGRAICLERDGKRISLQRPGTKLLHALRRQYRRVIQASARRSPRLRGMLAPLLCALFALCMYASPAAAQFTITNSVTPTNVAPGGTVVYTQVLTYTSATTFTPSAANPVKTTQTVPTGLTYTGATFTGTASTHWGCAVAGTTLTCTDQSNAVAYHNTNTTTLKITMTVGTATPSGTLTDTVTPTPGGVGVSAPINVSTPNLSVTGTAAPNPVATGAQITFSETVTNNSTTTAAVNATLTQSTPPNTTFVSATPPGGWTCGTTPAAGGTGSIVCTATAAMAASTSVNFTIVVAVNSGAPGGTTITDMPVTVSETGTNAGTPNNISISTTVQGADLSMTQVASASAVAPGNTITYTETVTNNGPNAATGAVLYQQTPTNTTFSSITPPTGWTCGTTPAAGNTGEVLCSATGTLGANTTSGTLTYTVTVGAATAAGTTIVNSADVTSTTTDPVSSNNTTSTSVLVEITGNADLAISMSAAPTPVFVSSALSYTIQVTNLGLATAAGVTVVDTLPATLVNPTAITSQGSCGAVTGGTITCTLGTVAYPLGTPITITVSGTTPATGSPLTNQAVVSTTTTDPVASNNTATVVTVVQPLVCAMPGKDGAGGTLSGVVNAYYPPAAGTVAAGATSITLGAAAAAPAAQTPIAVGDLLLVIQTQGAQINSTNTSSYGDGVPGDPASGSTSLGSSGQFEFVTATAAVPVAGGALTFTGTGSGGGLLNSYTSAAATTTRGIQTYQVIRVPQYTTAIFSSTLAALPWNGAVGGVLAVDVASQLTLGGTVSLDGTGFRGGAGRDLGGAPGTLATDVVTLSTQAANGSKGEGIAGTPHYIAPALSTITPATTAVSTGQTVLEGLPNGSYARGGPGNAAGGSTDANPTSNNQNSGGGAGGNGGTGGTGGFGWQSAGVVGGFGGQPFPASTSAIVMGGGGGAGTTNDGSYWNPTTNAGNADCGANCTGIYSSGTAGGGIVIIHTGSVAGTGTISANGVTALETENDGGGGGGGGGSILIFANSGSLSGLTASAAGGNGGVTWPADPPGTPFPGNRHGPGGGGGGGVIFASAMPGSPNVNGGIPGWSTLANDSYGATSGQAGFVSSGLSITETPGTQSGAYCAGADLAVTNSGTPSVVVPGNNITYTQTVTNNGPQDAVNATFIEAVPGNTTFQSLVIAPGWSCTTPAVGTAGNINCTNPDVASAAVGTFTVGVQVIPGTVSGTQILDTDAVSSGTNDPNLANNIASVLTIVGSATSADLVVTATAAPNPVQAGNNITYTVTVHNNGPAATSSVTFTDAIPANTTFVSLAQTGTAWVCPAPGASVNCTITSLPPGATTTFTLIVTVAAGAASGTVISNTASTSTSTPDPNPSSNSSTVNVTVASAGQFDLSVTSSASPNPVTPSNNITFLLNFANNGPNSASNVVFTDTIPANTTFVSLVLPAGVTCPTLPAVGGTGTISCCPGTGGVCSGVAVPSGSAAQLPLVVKVNASAAPGTVISNTASIGPTTNDVNPANNTSTATAVVASPTQADVAIVKTAAPEPVDQGATLTYTLQVTNNGPAVAQNVNVSDPLPSQVTFVSVSTTQGTCSQSAGTVSCSLGSVSVGGFVSITINTTAVTFSSSSLVVNTATVSSSTSDPNSSNNMSSAISTIQAPTAVQLSSFRAQTRSGGGVLLEWRTHEEVRNLGFHVYREDAQGRHQLDPSLIAGGALLLRGGQPQHPARTYQWFDPQGGPGSSYVLEDVDLSGVHNTHGPVSPEASPDSTVSEITPMSQATLLTQLSQLSASPASSSSMAFPSRPGAPVPVVPPVNPSAPSSAAEVSSAYLDALPAAKISVNAEGWYVVTRAQLVAAGFDPGSDARTLQLFAEGVEQPMAILGQQGASLSSNGAIAFYGTAIDTPFSGTRVYWLVRGSQAGKRISVSTSAGSGASSVQSFLSSVTLEQRTTYFAALLNGPNADNFFGALVSTDPVDQDLTIQHYDPSSSIPAQVTITLQGVTAGQPHSVSATVNGSSVGVLNFDGQANFSSTFAIEQGSLHDGANTITLTALNGESDTSLVQSIVLNYSHTYTADSDWLRAAAPAGAHIKISGFASSQIQAYDVSDPLNIIQLAGPVTFENTGSSITITVPGAPSSAAPHTFIAFAADQISSAAAITYHPQSSLEQQRSGSDIVIITYADFASTLAPLISLRKSQQHEVTVVTTDQLFDAFNYGERSPFALQSYLQLASTQWREKPQAVLLVGDASFDPRNYLGLGDFDFVPTRIIETAAFKTASDDWFSDFQGTGFATIPTGRIPARTASDAALVVSKIVNYERGASQGAWTQQALVIADQNVGVDFSGEAEMAATLLPPSLVTTKILADGQSTSVVSQQIVDAVNNGTLLVNYTGHGSEQQWSFADLLDNNSVASFNNGGRLPVFLLMDCLNGFFHDVYAESLSSALLLAPNGGAVAVWASSGFTTAPPQAAMDQALLRALAANPSQPLGRSILTSKLNITDPDVRRTWILFGDPAIRVAFPTASSPIRTKPIVVPIVPKPPQLR